MHDPTLTAHIDRGLAGALAVLDAEASVVRWSGVDLYAARLLGNALVQRPLMPRELIGTAWCHYVHPAARTTIRITMLSRFLQCGHLSAPEYWRNVDRLHYFLLSRIERSALKSAA